MVDPHAATVLTPDTASRASTSVPDAAPAANQADVAGTDTSDPVSLLVARPSPVTRRVVVALAVVGFTGIGGTVALRTASDRSGATTTLVAARSGEPTTALPPAPQELPSGSVAPLSSSGVVDSPPAPSAARPSRVVAPAGSVRTVNPARADGGSPVACDSREVLSNGHCCPRGLVWQFDRCERPIATTF